MLWNLKKRGEWLKWREGEGGFLERYRKKRENG